VPEEKAKADPAKRIDGIFFSPKGQEITLNRKENFYASVQ